MRAIAMVAEKAKRPRDPGDAAHGLGEQQRDRSSSTSGTRGSATSRPSRCIDDPTWTREVLEPAIAERAREIIRLTGGSPAGSAAQAILTTIRAITAPTPFEHWFGAGVLSDGSYGVPRGLVFGFPLVTSDGKSWSIAQGLYLDEHAHKRIAQNVAELELEASSVSHLLGKA